MNHMITTVDDDGNLTIPDEFLEQLNWKEGDTLEWIDRGNGEFELRKIEETNNGTSTNSN